MRRRPPRYVSVGNGVRLGRDVELDVAAGGRIVLEDGCAIGDGCRLLARNGEIRIGAGAVLEPRCTLLAHIGISVGARARLGDGAMAVDFNHVIDDPETPIRLQPLDAAPVAIGAGAVLGPGANVLKGVTVGEGATVGAHSVVTHDVAAGARVDGVPARPATGAAARPSTATTPPG